MGWGSGATIFEKVIISLQHHVPDFEQRVDIYTDLIEAFEEGDWDTQDDCRGIDKAYDEALDTLYPFEIEIDLEDDEEEDPEDE